jgi:uncharacterized protein
MLLTTMIVALVLLVFLWAMQRRLMYFPLGEVLAPADVGVTRAESVAFLTSDGLLLHGWFFPALPSPARRTIVVFNGNAGNRSYRAPLATALQARGHAVLLFDYRGYGGNPGAPTESGLREDARAARAFLMTRADVDPERIVYFGESLGTGVAVTLAAEHPPAALVLRSPFTSMTDVGRMHYPIFPVRWLLRDRYASSERIAQIRCPLLVVAGDRDGVIPLEYSQRLYDAAPSPKQMLVIPGADHNDQALTAGDEMIAAVDTFLQRESTRSASGHSP